MMRGNTDIPGKDRLIGVIKSIDCEGSAFLRGMALLLVSLPAEFTTVNLIQS